MIICDVCGASDTRSIRFAVHEPEPRPTFVNGTPIPPMPPTDDDHRRTRAKLDLCGGCYRAIAGDNLRQFIRSALMMCHRGRTKEPVSERVA